MLLPAALAFFQRAFAIADSLALAAALIFAFRFGAAAVPLLALSLAHLARAAAAILARTAALMCRFLGAPAAGWDDLGRAALGLERVHLGLAAGLLVAAQLLTADR